MDVRAVNRVLRAVLWPALRDHGFETRTDRKAWRYWSGGVEVIDISSIGTLVDAAGCTPYSFGATLGSLPTFLGARQAVSVDKDGRPRPETVHN